MGISDSGTRVALRLPEQLHKRLTARSRQNQRSLNSEIVFALQGDLGTAYTITSTQPKHYVAEGMANESVLEELIDQCKSLSTSQQQALLKFLREGS